MAMTEEEMLKKFEEVTAMTVAEQAKCVTRVLQGYWLSGVPQAICSCPENVGGVASIQDGNRGGAGRLGGGHGRRCADRGS